MLVLVVGSLCGGCACACARSRYLPIVQAGVKAIDDFLEVKKGVCFADYCAKIESLRELAYGMLDHSSWQARIPEGERESFDVILATAKETILRQKGLRRQPEADKTGWSWVLGCVLVVGSCG